MSESALTKRSSEFYWEPVVFKVEDTLFRVPRQEFEETSEVFSDMFRLPTGSLQTADGSSDEKPILLEGHKALDFANLLKIMYLRPSTWTSDTNPTIQLSKKDWFGVLRLSEMWNMKRVLAYVAENIAAGDTLTSLEKIEIGKSHGLSQLVRDGINGLIEERPIPLFEDLGRSLGWKGAAKFLHMMLDPRK